MGSAVYVVPKIQLASDTHCPYRKPLSFNLWPRCDQKVESKFGHFW